jgi:O-antigen/teichoic acid export membrane protein
VGGQAVFLAVSTGVGQVLIALVYIFAARDSDPMTLGLAVAAIALGTSAAGFIDFGTNSHWVREIARGSMDAVELGKRLSGKLVAATALGALWAVVTTVLLPTTHLWIAAPVMVALLANQSSQVPLRADARGDRVAMVIVADKIVAAGVFFVLIVVGADPITVLWMAIVAGSLVAAGLGWILAAKDRRPVLAVSRRTNPWTDAGYFGLAGLANSAQALDLPLLSVVGGSAAAGLYGAVNRWTQPMSLLASAFASASAPFVARSKNIVAAWHHLRRGLWMPLAAIALSLLVFAGAPWIVPFLLGDAYAGSVDVLRILALVSIPSIIIQPVIVALQALGRDRYVAFAMSGAVIVQLLLVAVLGGMLGAWGAAIASLVTQVLLLVAFATAVWVEYRDAVKRESVSP